jgi:transposase-like protein
VGTKKRVNKYPKAFRPMALERMKNCESVSALAEVIGIHRTVLYHWKNHLRYFSV